MYKHRGPHVTGSTKVLLLYLADHMDSDLTVSVPRSTLAKDLGVNVRRVTEWTQAAVAAGLLDHVQRGRPGVTAVYIGTFPGASKEIPDGAPEGASVGAPVRTKLTAQHGAKKRTKLTAQHGADGGPANSKHNSTSTRECEPCQQLHDHDYVAAHTDEEDHSFKAAIAAQADPQPIAALMNMFDRQAVDDHAVGVVKPGIDEVDRATRKKLIDAIQACELCTWEEDGTLKGTRTRYPSTELCDLLDALEPGLGANVVTDRYLAGIQLNKLINTYRAAA